MDGWSSILLLLATALVADARHKTRHRGRHHHAQKPSLRVYKGSDVPEHMYPYVVILSKGKIIIPSIDDDISRWCTGSLISESWVLTAGRCVNKEDINGDPRAYYGDFTNIHNSTKYKRGLRIFYPNHKDSIYPVIENDIGLLMIETLVLKPQQYGRISAVDYKSLIGLPVRYVGGGRTYIYNATIKERLEVLKEDKERPLQAGEAVVVKCLNQREYRGTFNFKTNSPYICLKSKCSEKYQGTRPGDSGGPLLHRGKIIGVACCVQDARNFFYTAVSPYLSWIHDVIARNPVPAEKRL